MQFALISELVPAVIIVHTISTIRILLYFTYKDSGSNSMNCAGFDHNAVTFADFYLIKNIRYCVILNTFSYLFFAGILRKTAIQISAGFTVNNIPHFILAKFILIS